MFVLLCVQVPDQKILELEGDLPMMDPSGVIGLNVRIKQVSMQHENRPFRIKVSSSGDAAQYGVIEPALSPPMTVMYAYVRPHSLFFSIDTFLLV